MKKLLLLFLLLPFLGFGQLQPGNYVINRYNSDANFTTLAAAVSHVNSVGISGAVTFLLDENQTVNSTIVINQFKGSSALNTLTIRPNSKMITITGNINQGAVLALNNAANINIDGNNLLTVYNENKFGYGQRAGIQIYNGSNSNKIQNLKVNMEIERITTGILSVGIFAGGSSLGSSGNNPNNTIENITFTNVKQAIMVVGESQNNVDWKILNNTIKSTEDAGKAFLGIYVVNAKNFTVSGNTVSGIKLPAEVGSNPFHSGVYLENANNSSISKNTISSIKNSAGYSVGYGIFIKGDNNQISENSIKDLESNSSNDGSYGIKSIGNYTTVYSNDIANVFSSQSTNTNGIYVAGDNQLIYNNFINDVKATGGGGTDSQNGFGIYISGGRSIKIYYNTVVLRTNQNEGVSAALFIKAGSELDIRNNLFVNNQSGGAQRFAIYSKVTTSSNFIHLDYNNYYSSQYVGSLGDYYTTTNRHTSLTEWIKATGKDVNSKNYQPVFVSSDDLHLKSGSANDNLRGVSISGISTDIDGETRVKPYMGADEIMSCLLVATVKGNGQVCNNSNAVFDLTGTAKAKVTYIINGVTHNLLLSDLGTGQVIVAGVTVDQILSLVSVANGACSALVEASAIVNVGKVSIYDGKIWDNERPNNNGLSALIAGDYDTSKEGGFSACNCTVNNGAVLTVAAETYVEVQNDIINSGRIVVQSDGNFIQNNDLGKYTSNADAVFMVERISNMKRLDYTYWSSPVKAQQLKSFSPSSVSTRFLEYHENDDLFYTVDWLSNFVVAKGYAIRAPNNYPVWTDPADAVSKDFKGIFIGIPNNGVKNFILKFHSETNPAGIGNGYNLVGNPYSSNIDFDKLFNLNSSKIHQTAYFWTNVDPNRPVSTNGTGSTYSGNAYAIYNGTGGVSAAAKVATKNGMLVGVGAVPNKEIKVGQGFIVKARSGQDDQSLVFNNSIRSNSNESNFFSKGSDADKDRFWLQLTSPALNVNNILIGYIANATNGFELDYDAPLMTIGSDSFYSVLNEDKLGIQGRQYPFNTFDVVELGTNHYETGDYTISLGAREGIFVNGQNIYLKDRQTGIITNLTERNYVFQANAGESTGRFEIMYKPETVLVTDAKLKEGVVVYRDGNDFVFKSPKTIANVQVYGLSGKLVKILKPNSKQGVLDFTRIANGMYLLKITSANGEVTDKKILK